MAIQRKRKCDQCGIVFIKLIYPSSKKTKNSFCSKKCVDDHKRNGSKLKCKRCGKEFYRRFGEQRKAKTFFCSRLCRDKNRMELAKPTTYLKDNARHKHRIVAENKLGRALKKGEIVHHLDGDKHNNDPDNLRIFVNQAEHARYHFSGKHKCFVKNLKNARVEAKENKLF